MQCFFAPFSRTEGLRSVEPKSGQSRPIPQWHSRCLAFPSLKTPHWPSSIYHLRSVMSRPQLYVSFLQNQAFFSLVSVVANPHSTGLVFSVDMMWISIGVCGRFPSFTIPWYHLSSTFIQPLSLSSLLLYHIYLIYDSFYKENHNFVSKSFD